MKNSFISRFKRYDTLATGIILGIIVPVAVYFILYFSKIQSVRYTLFSHHLVISNIIPVVISHCILPNLIFFLLFNNFDWMQASKGIMGSTVVLTVLIFAIKLIFSII